MPPRRSPRVNLGATPPPPPPPPVMDAAAIEAMIAQRVTTALANFSADRQNGSGAGNSNSHGESRGPPRACSYKDFSNCKPKLFYGNGGVIALTRWFEKTESVFEICSCPNESKVKFAACTFMDAALSWWNGHVKTMGLVAANAMTWHELKVMMLEEYCPRGEVQNLEQEFWNLTMKGSEITAYTNRFNDLAVLCPGMVTPEYKKVERYIWGLAPQIQGMVVASRPTTYDSAKRIAQQLTDQGVRQGTMVQKVDPPRERDNKRKFKGRNKGNHRQAPPKKQETVSVFAATAPVTIAQPKQYAGNLPKCNKCNFHHNGACREMFCFNCKQKGHTTRVCKALVQGTNKAPNSGVSRACYGCGENGHFKKDCPKAKGPGGGGQEGF